MWYFFCTLFKVPMNWLFVSDRCEHSKHMVELVQANNLSERFRLVDVRDSPIPREVTSVPSIIDVSSKRVFSGIGAFDFLKTLLKDELTPYVLGSSQDMTYSFLQGGGEMVKPPTFVPVDGEPFQEVTTSEGKPGVDPRLQKLLDERNSDAAVPKPISRA